MTLDRLAAVLDDDRLDPWLRRGLRVWTRLGGALPLEKCLRLPRGARAYARCERDRWLRVAFAHVGSVAELHRALMRDGWRLVLWLERGGPPVRATPLQVALFNSIEPGAPIPTLRQLRRIIGTSKGASMSSRGEETFR